MGVCKALKGYAKWFTEVELPGCEFSSNTVQVSNLGSLTIHVTRL